MRPRPRLLREVAQFTFIVLLVVSAWLTGRSVDNLRESNDDLADDLAVARSDTAANAQSVEAVESILADVCKVTSNKALDNGGLDTECKLAEAGNIEERAPVVEPPPGEPAGVSQDQVEAVVDAYLRRYLTDLPDRYRADLRQAVAAHLTRNPPKPGKDGEDAAPPTTRQIAAAVADYLTANPPPAGADGADGAAGAAGVGVTSASLDGCDVVFTFTDGTTARVGPICGPGGATGEKGSTGDPGRDGRGIASTQCVTDDTDTGSHWEITYTDDTTGRADGPCRAQQPTPPPDPPPGGLLGG